MLTQSYRFHGHKSMGFVFRHGLVVRGRHMLVRIHKHPQRTKSRVAIVVSKKVARRAHERNRIRRRIYEAVRTSWDDIPAPYDVVFVVMDPAVGVMPWDDLRTEVVSLLRQGHHSHQRKDT